ncbi:SH3 domain-containing protein [Chitinilyticum litopenaei]|uniref:SH3 domain-containing protein n=1 Tax=Chitinilyticum litopenaei TaxID=1121276 RepID=UPI00048E2BCE|nr:SH3 domain-containing protein [Chitinilyticum litopenaei]
MPKPRPLTKLLLASALLAGSPLTLALEFRSVARDGALWYEQPAANARKLFIVSKGMPVEILAEQPGWLRVRDRSGALAWMQAGELSKQRTVQAIRNTTVFAGPQDKAPVVFRVEKDVLLTLLDAQQNGWIQVQHRDGQRGFVRIEDIWGL